MNSVKKNISITTFDKLDSFHNQVSKDIIKVAEELFDTLRNGLIRLDADQENDGIEFEISKGKNPKLVFSFKLVKNNEKFCLIDFDIWVAE